MNSLNTNTKTEQYIEETITIVRNLLKQQLIYAPSHGLIGVDIFFRDGEPARIISKNKTSTLLIGSSGAKNAH